MNVDFNALGLSLAVRLTQKNKIPKNQKGLATVIKKHCTLNTGIFLKEYYNNVKNYEQSVEFREKILAVTWDLLSK